MITTLPYPFTIESLRRNKAFMLFCPPDVLDEERRPVLEGRSLLHKLEESDLQPCPYADSRGHSGKPMNVGSLKAFSRNQEAVAGFIQAAGQFVAALCADEVTEPDLGHLYALSYIGYRAPTRYFCNKLFDDRSEIPAVCSVTSRFFHGLLNMLALIALEHDGHLTGVRMSAQALYQYADERGHLVGSDEACAASKAIIIKYLSLSLQSCQRAQTIAEHLAEPHIDLQAVCRIAQVTMELEFASLVYETMRCWQWRRQSGDAAQVAQMFATKHCFLAKKLSLTANPFEHALFKRAQHLLLTFGPQRESIQRLVETAIECVGQMPYGRAQHVLSHERLKRQMCNIFDQQAETIDAYIAGGSFLSSDVDMFFGRWPD